jgi:hypothetical protein
MVSPKPRNPLHEWCKTSGFGRKKGSQTMQHPARPYLKQLTHPTRIPLTALKVKTIHTPATTAAPISL